MSFRTESTLAGYARAAIDLRARMTDYCRSRFAQQYLRAFLETRQASISPDDPTPPPAVMTAFDRLAYQPWQLGEPYVLAPAMTAIVAAAAQALDLSGEVVPNDVAPGDFGVLFLPEAIYHGAYEARSHRSARSPGPRSTTPPPAAPAGGSSDGPTATIPLIPPPCAVAGNWPKHRNSPPSSAPTS
jgi:hypothetical protein